MGTIGYQIDSGLMKCPICREPEAATDLEVTHNRRQKSVDDETTHEKDSDSEGEGM